MGIKVNKSGNNPVDYAQNAMYSEMSKQQTTQAKIDTQGGVFNAVASDVAESSLKAAKQQQGTQAELAQQIAKTLTTSDGKPLDERVASGIGKELASQIMKGGEQLGSSLKSVLGEGVQVKGLGDGAKLSDVASLVLRVEQVL